MDAKPDTYRGPELDERVAERIAEMSYADLRDECDTYRAWKRIRPSGFRFGEWLRTRQLKRVIEEASQ